MKNHGARPACLWTPATYMNSKTSRRNGQSSAFICNECVPEKPGKCERGATGPCGERQLEWWPHERNRLWRGLGMYRVCSLRGNAALQGGRHHRCQAPAAILAEMVGIGTNGTTIHSFIHLTFLEHLSCSSKGSPIGGIWFVSLFGGLNGKMQVKGFIGCLSPSKCSLNLIKSTTPHSKFHMF